MKKKLTAIMVFLAISLAFVPITHACSRFIYEAGDNMFLTGRSMDWATDLYSDIWAYPRNMKKDGGVGPDSIKWTSKYGSVTMSGFDIGTADGINEKGLVANLLYLAEAGYGKLNGKPGMSVGAWPQYILDNYATVAEAVKGLRSEPFRIVPAIFPDGAESSLHVSISDPTGDSAIFEYIDGKLVIHHGKQYPVMTNSPTFAQQIALNAYWKSIGGLIFLPGTNRAADRFARASYYINAVPKFKDEQKAVAAAFSILRNISVPLGITDPSKPNISSTLWRSVADQKNLKYYYESAVSPNIFWVDLSKMDFRSGTSPKRIDLDGHPTMAGEVSAHFVPAKPFKWLAPGKH